MLRSYRKGSRDRGFTFEIKFPLRSTVWRSGKETIAAMSDTPALAAFKPM